MTPHTHATEVETGERFAFGENWARFLNSVNEERIAAAVESLKTMLEVEDLEGKSFLDAGSGSGLFSLAAVRLGARVHSFDYDPQSVSCTQELKRRYAARAADWSIEAGSVLDAAYLEALGRFDIVYSWGVLHHTGDMWMAMENAAGCVAPGGRLYVALYNRQPLATGYWVRVKRVFNRYPVSRPFLIALHALYPTLPSLVLRYIQGREAPRGMSVWHDLIDWLGGYPFEVARPEEVLRFLRARQFILINLATVGGRSGCNEFVFERAD